MIRWLPVFLCVACVEEPKPEDTGEPPVVETCDYDNPTTRTLAWDDPCAAGTTAEDFLGWGIGTFTTPLVWDDGLDETATGLFEPGEVTEISYGPVEDCVGPSLEMVVTVTLSGARMALRFEDRWGVEEADGEANLGDLVAQTAPTEEDLGISRIEVGSQLLLGAHLDDAQGLFLSVTEQWALSDTVTRRCVRAAGSADDLRCDDIEDEDGAE